MLFILIFDIMGRGAVVAHLLALLAHNGGEARIGRLRRGIYYPNKGVRKTPICVVSF